jgi:hypothetical protein
MFQERIYHFLDTDNQFRAQIADLLANNSTEIEIEEDMSSVTYIPRLAARVLN